MTNVIEKIWVGNQSFHQRLHGPATAEPWAGTRLGKPKPAQPNPHYGPKLKPGGKHQSLQQLLEPNVHRDYFISLLD